MRTYLLEVRDDGLKITVDYIPRELSRLLYLSSGTQNKTCMKLKDKDSNLHLHKEDTRFLAL